MGRLRDKWESIRAYFKEMEKETYIKDTLDEISNYDRGEWEVSNGVHFGLHPIRMSSAWVVKDDIRMDLWGTHGGYKVSDPTLRQWLFEGVVLLDQEIKERNQRWAAERAQKEKEFASHHYPNRYSQER